MSVSAEEVQLAVNELATNWSRFQELLREVKPVKPVSPVEHLQHFLTVEAPIFIYEPPCRYGLFEDSHSLFKACRSSKLYNITTVTNVCLEDLDFDRVVDPVQAYQQLELFLNNTLVKPVEIQEPDDKLKRDMHGFDALSFKQTSPGKKAKRKKYA